MLATCLMELIIPSCIHGYHVYGEIWTAVLDEQLFWTFANVKSVMLWTDSYAVAAKNDSRITVGHLPRKISRICSIFLMGGGTITATVTGRRRSRELRNYASHNLTQILMARIESNARLKSSRK